MYTLDPVDRNRMMSLPQGMAVTVRSNRASPRAFSERGAIIARGSVEAPLLRIKHVIVIRAS